MFRIRRIYDSIIPTNKEVILQVQRIMRAQFPDLPEKDILSLPEKLNNPIKYKFRSILFVAENSKRQVKGFGLLSHAPDLKFCYLDIISTEKEQTGKGVGGAIYERIREEALHLKAIGLFLECLPDDPNLCKDPLILKQNSSRLRFYEKFGARPIINTAYETPVKLGGDNPPYLVFDSLGRNIKLRRIKARQIVRTILKQKYGRLCPDDYIEKVVSSFKDDPIRIREPRYFKRGTHSNIGNSIPLDKRIILVINDKHTIHHVRERGYVESPVRVQSILNGIDQTNLFQKFSPRNFSERHIKSVHDARFVEYLKLVCLKIEPTKSIYPYVFPIRNAARPPKELVLRAGYYCIDTFTPLNRNAFLAARRAVNCTLTAAKKILEGYRLAYALVRPPGHHAEHKAFGGFCYFNSSAIAAQYLSEYGKVAILDIDYHHGNGQQIIFYERSDVLTVSIHGHPSFTYPYFSGFTEEIGNGIGKGYNLNIPLPESIDRERYREALMKAMGRVNRFRPRYLIVAFGLDTATKDPTGSWSLQAKDFEVNGQVIGLAKLPTLVVQEGGYNNRSIGRNARHFFKGLWTGAFS